MCRSLVLLLAFTWWGAVPATRAVELTPGKGGRLILVTEDHQITELRPFIANRNWAFAYGASTGPEAGGRYPFTIQTDGKTVAGELAPAAEGNGVRVAWTFTAKEAVDLSDLGVAARFPIADLAGCAWKSGDASGKFPAAFGQPHLFGSKARDLTLAFRDGKKLSFTFPEPTQVLLQDNRQWGDSTYSLRLGQGGGSLAAGESFRLVTNIGITGGLAWSPQPPKFLQPVTLQADKDWVVLQDAGDIQPGSALDLTPLGLTPAPCGAQGRVIINPQGHFAFAQDPATPRRFYGVNFCFSALYLEKKNVDRLLDRLVRLGYNTVRVHHYEPHLTEPPYQAGMDWNPERLDQLDYFLAGCAKRGIWISTDLYVSRQVAGDRVGRPGTERVEPDTFKMLVPVSEPAFADWCAFARKFLDRVNPYTGKKLAEDPTIAWISLINEGPSANNWGVLHVQPEWQAAWNRWLAARYPDRAALETALPGIGKDENPAAGNVALPGEIASAEPRANLARLFVADTEKTSFERMRDFLRNELHCQALLTNLNNAGPSHVALHRARASFDYVDEHFYVDHPQFLETPWRLPSFSLNANPMASGASGGSACASVRLWGKPFTISEYNYAAPGPFRGVGGILTGAMAALQGWDGLWRFAYSHHRDNLFQPSPIGFFDLVSDPLNQAADRLGVLLFLRGDVRTAPDGVAAVIPPAVLDAPPSGLSLSGLQAVAWNVGIGSSIGEPSPKLTTKLVTVPIESAGNGDAVIQALRQAGVRFTDKNETVVMSETQDIHLIPSQGALVVDTLRSAGGYALAGASFHAIRAGVTVGDLTTAATVFVSSLEDKPIRDAGRLLVTHLTDMQNTGAHFGEGARQTVIDFGKLPHLVRDGAATVRVTLADPQAYKVWALSTSGKRLEPVEAKIEGSELVFTTRVRGPDDHARMLYEIAKM